jgi:hypothetical protein
VGFFKWSEPWAENKNLLRSMKPDELGFSAQNSILDKIIVPFCLVHFSRQVVNLNHSKILLGHLCKPGFPPKPTSVAVISRLDKQVDFVLFVLHVLFVLEASHYLFNLNILFDVI